MSLADSLKPTRAEVRGDKIQILLRHLKDTDPDEHEALASALGDESYSHADIGRALRAEGHDINAGQVRHWRTKFRDGEVKF